MEDTLADLGPYRGVFAISSSDTIGPFLNAGETGSPHTCEVKGFAGDKAFYKSHSSKILTMFRNYLKIAYRNLIKNKVYTLVNVFGLAIGMAACFFIFQYVHFETSYDGFNKNQANIYRVNISFGGSFSNLSPMSTNHPAVGPAMKKEFPEVVDYARVVNPVIFMAASNISYTNTKGNAVIFNPGKLYFADASFLTMFSFPFVSGDPSTALIGARTTVISKKLAQKYFGKEDPMGKTLL